MLPAFLRVRGLVKQHLDSYNHLVNIEIKHIVRANERITCDNHPTFYLKFLDVYLGAPSVEEDMKKPPKLSAILKGARGLGAFKKKA